MSKADDITSPHSPLWNQGLIDFCFIGPSCLFNGDELRFFPQILSLQSI